MQRRQFLKTSAAFYAATAALPVWMQAKKKAPFGITDKSRIFSVTNTFTLPKADKKTRLWVPLPMNAPYHQPVKLSYEGSFDKAYISYDNPYNTKLLYAEFEARSKENKLRLEYDVAMTQVSANLDAAKNSMRFPKEVQTFLKGTPHVPVSSFLQEYVAKIVTPDMTPLQKVRAIYDWTVANMYRDPDVIGCGLGDAQRVLRENAFGGKCTDISSVFVALVRNAGIPAREVFGLRAGQSRISDSCGSADADGVAENTTWQHCRAQVYLNGCGWIPCDPADVTKVQLQEGLKDDSERLQAVKEYFFGNWEMNWIAFNYARDFILDPKPAQYPLNMLNYPYAEAGEDVLNYYKPEEFGYSYRTKEIKI
ncbi:MAG: transglutaminase-like domain-containing protein [Campylobacterota bacterium]